MTRASKGDSVLSRSSASGSQHHKPSSSFKENALKPALIETAMEENEEDDHSEMDTTKLIDVNLDYFKELKHANSDKRVGEDDEEMAIDHKMGMADPNRREEEGIEQPPIYALTLSWNMTT